MLARIVYKPIGIICGVLAGLVSRRLFTVLWGRIDDAEPPEATTQEARLAKVISAAALQAAVFAATRAVVDRYGARGFHYLTGIWPGERRPDEA